MRYLNENSTYVLNNKEEIKLTPYTGTGVKDAAWYRRGRIDRFTRYYSSTGECLIAEHLGLNRAPTEDIAYEKLQLKVGGVYLDRFGRTQRVTSKVIEGQICYEQGYRFHAGGLTYTTNGCHHAGSSYSSYDLMEEVPEEKPEKTKPAAPVAPVPPKIVIGGEYIHTDSGEPVKCMQVIQTFKHVTDASGVVVTSKIKYVVEGTHFSVEADDTKLSVPPLINWNKSPEWARQLKYIDGAWYWFARVTVTPWEYNDHLHKVITPSIQEDKLDRNKVYTRE